jgi:ethanolamine ammonia-lyase small subunit
MTATVADRLWERFRRSTRARIGLGRTGDSLPTRRLLEFQYAHASARDAVHSQLDAAAFAAAVAPRTCIRVSSQAEDRAAYLRRPDFGRRLAQGSLGVLPTGPFDAVFVVADGLSAGAVQTHAPKLLGALLPLLLASWRLGPLIVAEQARVALGDEIAVRMGAQMVVVLIGERPGLSVPNSLGVYLTYAPRVGRRDSERNCVSNIHADGLSYAAAADKLHWLMAQARLLQLTGIELKEDAPLMLPGDLVHGQQP